MNGKIKYTNDNMMRVILQHFPEYHFSWQEHIIYWAGDESLRSIGIDINNFAHYVADKIKNELNEQFLTQVFELIENFITFGDDEVQYAATSFLQDITNTFSHYTEQIPYEFYIPLLGPRSKAFCRYLDEFYGTETPGL